MALDVAAACQELSGWLTGPLLTCRIVAHQH
jgi:hypothetical protein